MQQLHTLTKTGRWTWSAETSGKGGGRGSSRVGGGGELGGGGGFYQKGREDLDATAI